jgi:uroporphyrinogen decarboxylase
LNEPLYARVVPELTDEPDAPSAAHKRQMIAYCRLGYDYTTFRVPGFDLNTAYTAQRKEKTISLNEGSLIHSRADFDAYEWADPDAADWDSIRRLAQDLPAGMKLIVYGPNGVLENAIDLVGYERLCLMLYDDPQLAHDIFEQVGARLVRYYERAARCACVGACISNDDWGFKTQTLLSTAALRRFVFPWHKRIVETVHAAGKPVILHSCGHFAKIMDDIADDIRFDGRHSYEDTIMPVEDAYEQYRGRIAILGGIDVDFVCRSTPEEVYARSKAMLERSSHGGYALGTGNSVPDYVPDANYFAMLRAALEQR